MFIDKLGLDKLDKLTFGRLSGDDLEETLTSSTPLLAVVGAGDLALEKLRAARSELLDRTASFDAATFRDEAQASLVERIEALQSDLMTAPEQLRSLPEKAQEWPARAQSLLADLISTAFSTYGELAGRGKAVVTQVRGGPADEFDAYDDDLAPVSRPVPPASSPVTSPLARPETKLGTAPAAEPLAEPLAKPVVKRAPAVAPDTARSVAARATAAKSIATKPKKTPARESAAHRTAQKTSAQKTSAQKTSAQKTSAQKTAIQKSAARKASSAGKAAVPVTTTAEVKKALAVKKSSPVKKATGTTSAVPDAPLGPIG